MASKILFYLIILPISILPYPVIYLLSDTLYFVLYKLVGYRTEVVLKNIKNSFPEKDAKEHKVIMSQFYRHLCDLIVESIKGFTISEKQLRKRLIVTNPEVADQYANKGQGVIFVGGHINNWEICAQAVPFYSEHECIGIYKPLSNAFFDHKMKTTREKYGLRLASMKQTKKSFDKGGKPKAIIFGSDQSPSNPKRAYWLKFLNQDTGVLYGVEKYAKEYNWPVIYVTIYKTKRGHYEVEYKLITDTPLDTSYGEITTSFTKAIENDIIAHPQYWLWSHRRWKHKNPN